MGGYDSVLPELNRLTAGCAGLNCFFDFDGTLAPIAHHPEAVRLPDGIRSLLKRLHHPPLSQVAIVSGRAVEDLAGFFPGCDYALAGNHGLEIRLGRLPYVHPEANLARPAVCHAAHALKGRLARIPGCLVEHKGLTVSVHYRQVLPSAKDGVRDLVARTLKEGHWQDRLVIREGKQVLEVRPRVDWDKGRAVLWIMEQERGPEWEGRYMPVYVGDDDTDEDAFRRLRGRGLTVRVGPGDTAAGHRLDASHQVSDLLSHLADAVEELYGLRRKA